MRNQILFILAAFIGGAFVSGLIFTKCDRTPYTKEDIEYYKDRDRLREQYYQAKIDEGKEAVDKLKIQLDKRDGEIMSLTMEKNKLNKSLEERNKQLSKLSLKEKRDIFVFYTTSDSGMIVMEITEKQLVKAIQLFYELDYSKAMVRIQQSEISSMRSRKAVSDAIISELESMINTKDLYIEEIRSDNQEVILALEKRDNTIDKEIRKRKFWKTFSEVGIPVFFIGGVVLGTTL